MTSSRTAGLFGSQRVRVFFFGVGYCAEALIRNMPAIEPSGTARTEARGAELRARGVDAYVFDGGERRPGTGAGA